MTKNEGDQFNESISQEVCVEHVELVDPSDMPPEFEVPVHPTPEEQLEQPGKRDRAYIDRLARRLDQSDRGVLYSHVPIAGLRKVLRNRFARQFGRNHSLVVAAHREQQNTNN
jgi:hypothetical protein